MHHGHTWLQAALIAACLTGPAMAAPGCPAIPPRVPMPAEALPRPVDIPEWRQRTAQLTGQLGTKDMSWAKLVFVGDSITQSWEPTMWSLFWGGRAPLNLGLWGDLTQGMLWRLGNGQWSPSLRPDLVVLLIGTNNAGWGSRPEDTALGVAEIIRFIQARSPSSKVLLLGLLPRGADGSAPERAVNARVNELIQRCADGTSVVYMDPGRAMVGADGRISNQVLFDFLHPTMVGYAILGAGIEPQVRQMMGR